MNTQKGNTIIVIIVVLIIIIIGILVFKNKGISDTKEQTPTNEMTPGESANTQGVAPVNGSATGDVSIDQDLNSIDANLNGLSGDTNAIDGSLNDQPVAQPQ